jgi:hypothetical protein
VDSKKLKDQQKENQKEKSGKKKPGHGDPMKLVFIMREIGKTLDDGTTLFEKVNLSCFAGYLLFVSTPSYFVVPKLEFLV